MPTLTITRGLPGSGKTTHARDCQATHDDLVRVNRDDLRRMMFPTPDYGPDQEAAVTVAQHAAVRALLYAGHDVIADDTNVRPGFVDRWQHLAKRCGADLVIVDFTDVTPEECIRRQAGRPIRDQVPPDIIRQMAAQLAEES